MDIIKAIRLGDTEAVKNYIRSGGDIHATDENGKELILIAAMKGQNKCMQLLVDAGAVQHNGEEPVNEYGWTALMVCASKGNFEGIKILTEANANVNTRSLHNKTPLVLVLQHRYPNRMEIAEYLVLHGANPYDSIIENGSAMDYCNGYEDKELLRNAWHNWQSRLEPVM